MDAARHWARGPAGDPDRVADQFALAGAPLEIVDQVRANEEAKHPLFEVFEENVEAVEAFCALGTQWRIVAGMSGAFWQGLDYAAVPPTLDLMGVPVERRADVFAGLRLMEAAALPLRNAKAGDELAQPDV